VLGTLSSSEYELSEVCWSILNCLPAGKVFLVLLSVLVDGTASCVTFGGTRFATSACGLEAMSANGFLGTDIGIILVRLASSSFS
jgi:hypothetical protein